jgi:hypothetical protein
MAVKKGRTAPKAGKAKGAADAGSLAPKMPAPGASLKMKPIRPMLAVHPAIVVITGGKPKQ